MIVREGASQSGSGTRGSGTRARNSGGASAPVSSTAGGKGATSAFAGNTIACDMRPTRAGASGGTGGGGSGTVSASDAGTAAAGSSGNAAACSVFSSPSATAQLSTAHRASSGGPSIFSAISRASFS